MKTMETIQYQQKTSFPKLKTSFYWTQILAYVDKLEKLSDRKCWLLFFFYSSVIAIIVQFIILPYLLPQYHAGHGILGLTDNKGDLIYFHNFAAKNAALIHEEGWKALNLKPFGGPHIGLITILYALITPEPWVLIPFQAALHASGAYVLMKTISLVARSRPVALLSTFPFFFFPTPMFWYTQNHREGLSIFGTFLFVYGWTIFADQTSRSHYSIRHLFKSIIFIIIGLLPLYFSRPYQIQMIIIPSYIVSCILFCNLILDKINNNLSAKQLLSNGTLIIILPFLTTLVSNSLGSIQFIKSPPDPDLTTVTSSTMDQSIVNLGSNVHPTSKQQNIIAKSRTKHNSYSENPHSGIEELINILYPKSLNQLHLSSTLRKKPEFNSVLIGSKSYSFETNYNEDETSLDPFEEKYPILHYFVSLSNPLSENGANWKKTQFVPQSLDSRLYSLMDIRNGYRHTSPEAVTTIDVEVRPQSALEVLLYIPRALQIGLFAPFPEFWTDTGSKGSSKMMRMASAVEMAFAYLLIPFSLATIFFGRKKLVTLVPIIFHTSLLCIFSLVITNVGTLHRMRYGFLMTIVAIGISGIHLTFCNLKQSKYHP